MSTPNDILASLTGVNDNDGDLFGGEVGGGGEEIVPPDVVETNHATISTTSKLMQSGLIGDTNGGGLFDDVDAQEQEEAEKKSQAEQQAALQRTQRQDEEAAARQQADLQQQQQQQQQQINQQMESVHLGPSPFLVGGQDQPSLPQQYAMPQQQQQQSYPLYATPPRAGGPSPSTMPLQPSPTNQSMMVGQHMNQSMMMSQPSHMHPAMMGQTTRMNQQPQMHQQPNNISNMSQSMIHPPAHNNHMNQSMMGQHPNNMSQSMMGPPGNNMMNQPHNNQNMNQSMMHPPSYNNHMNQSTMSHSTINAHYNQPPHAYGAPPGNVTAGMHNATPNQGLPPQMRSYPVPAAPTQYGTVTVDQPILLAGKSNFLVKSSPYWSYQIATQVPPHVWVVRRRFRDVVALEDRLRQDCPGAILPPRPDKHATRAIEEASAQQSQEFAIQRANELQVYFQQLVQHPMASQSGTLRFFLSLQDDLGTAWPEVSSNAITRLANAGVEAAVKTAEQWTPETDSEDNAELLALYSMESVRMGAVLQAVPKLEGALSLIQEHSELSGNVGMEMGRWLKPADGTTSEGLEIVAGALLRSGRRSKRLSLELSAACASYSQQYKLCRNERLAFSDRRAALQRRSKERKMHMSHGFHSYGYPQGDMAGQEADEIGRRLLSEVSRIAIDRRRDWSGSLKIIAASFKEAAAERSAIWEATLTQFDQHYPGYYNAETLPPAYQQQQQQSPHHSHHQPPPQQPTIPYSQGGPPMQHSQVTPPYVPQQIPQQN